MSAYEDLVEDIARRLYVEHQTQLGRSITVPFDDLGRARTEMYVGMAEATVATMRAWLASPDTMREMERAMPEPTVATFPTGAEVPVTVLFDAKNTMSDVLKRVASGMIRL
jgi:hypothetical protein